MTFNFLCIYIYIFFTSYELFDVRREERIARKVIFIFRYLYVYFDKKRSVTKISKNICKDCS